MELSVNLLVAVVQRHPVMFVVVILVAVGLLLYAAADAIVGILLRITDRDDMRRDW